VLKVLKVLREVLVILHRDQLVPQVQQGLVVIKDQLHQKEIKVLKVIKDLKVLRDLKVVLQ
jgi:porphobilinogen deaminase